MKWNQQKKNITKPLRSSLQSQKFNSNESTHDLHGEQKKTHNRQQWKRSIRLWVNCDYFPLKLSANVSIKFQLDNQRTCFKCFWCFKIYNERSVLFFFVFLEKFSHLRTSSKFAEKICPYWAFLSVWQLTSDVMLSYHFLRTKNVIT